MTGAFLAPALVLLGAIVIYPTFATVVRSTYDRQGERFVGLENYQDVLGTTAFLVALRNNALWVIVFPFTVTFMGLVFAVLTERVRWATAFKLILFMPMAISLFAAGLIWRIVYETDPDRGLANAALSGVAGVVDPPGRYAGTRPAPTTGAEAGPDGSYVSPPLGTGPALLGFTGIAPRAVPPEARDARVPVPEGDEIVGVVWRDFSPTGTPAVLDPTELGMPGVRVSLVDPAGRVVERATTDEDGGFRFDRPERAAEHRVVVAASNFHAGFQGLEWLGVRSLTPTSGMGEQARALLSVPIVVLAQIVAMLWIWSGFSMVVIGAGLAALDREVLEAARMDGASEWQTFRRITLPLMRPVLVVVGVTMVINVLKIFDIVLAVAPESSQAASNVIALEMWRVGFTGAGDAGRSSAVAVVLFVLVVPIMLVNLRRIRR